MKFLIIDKKQRIGKNKIFTYATERIIEELKKKNFVYDFCNLDDIEILVKNSQLEISAKDIPLSDYTHILFRGHSFSNHKEYETKRMVVNYIEQKNTTKGAPAIKVQNAEAIKNMPYYNKIYMAYICAKNNLPYFSSFYRLSGEYKMKPSMLGGYPLIIKEYSGENDIRFIDGKEKIKKNVYKLNSEKDYQQEFLKEKKLSNYFLQEYSDVGEDMRIFVSKGQVVGGWRRIAKKGFMTVSNGEYLLYNKPSEEIKSLAEKTAKAFKADFIATDFMYKDNKPYVQEISLNPGFKAYEQKAAGDQPVNIAKYIIESFN